MKEMFSFTVKVFENGRFRLLEIHPGWPMDLKDITKDVLRIPGAQCAYIQDKGVLIIFQLIMVGPYPVVLSYYNVTNDTLKFICESDESGIEACMTLKGTVIYELNDNKTLKVGAGDHNLIVYKHVKNIVVFRENPVMTLDIHLDKLLLLKMSPTHSELDKILEIIEQKKNGQLFSTIANGSISLSHKLYRIIEALMGGKASESSTINILMNYLEEFVTNDLPKTKFNYSIDDIGTLLNIEAKIRGSNKEIMTLSEIFEASTSNERYADGKKMHVDKIREGLKFFTGMSPRDIRLDEALIQIAARIELEVKVGTLQKMTLGDHHSSFGFSEKYLSRKFKEKYGHTFEAFRNVALKKCRDEKDDLK